MTAIASPGRQAGRDGTDPKLTELLVWILVVGAALVVLWRAGSGALAPPAFTEPSSWLGWIESRDPALGALAILRLAGLVVATYLAAVTSVGLAVRMLGAVRLGVVVDRFTVPVVRRILAAGLAGSLTVAGPAGAARARTPTTVTTTTAPSDPDQQPRITMHRLVGATAPESPPTMRWLSPADSSTAAYEDWTVEPGQSFWSIAEAVLARSSNQPPPDSLIDPYWLRLIEANRSRLADPANPDLVFAGQVFTLPER